MTVTGEAEQEFLRDLPDLPARLRQGDRIEGEGACCPLESAGWFAGFPVGGVYLVALRNAIWSPETGAVLTSQGRVARAPAAQIPDRLAKAAVKRLQKSMGTADLPVLDRAALWFPAGAYNYGHFLFDAMPGLEALHQSAVTDCYPAVSPPLRPWQAEVVRQAGYGPLPQAPRHKAVRVETLVYATTLDHYLHRHGALFSAVLRRLQPHRPRLSEATKSLYLARPPFGSRQLLGEDEVIEEMRRRGTTVVDPSRLSFSDQMALFGQAHTVIGPSGAAFANMAFLPAGARVIELRPPPMAGAWIGLTAARLGLHHVPVETGPLLAWTELPLRLAASLAPRRILGRYAYACRIDPAAVLAALDRTAPGA